MNFFILLQSCSNQQKKFLHPEPNSETVRIPDAVSVDFSTNLLIMENRHSIEMGSTIISPHQVVSFEEGVLLVERFFHAIQNESIQDLKSSISPDAKILKADHYYDEESFDLISFWTKRFESLEYGKLRLETIYRVEEMEALPGCVGWTKFKIHGSVDCSNDDLLAKVRIIVSQIGSMKYFGKEMFLYITNVDGNAKISWMDESL